MRGNTAGAKFGGYLCELRKASGLSLDDVISRVSKKKLKLSKSALSLYERGEIKTPDPDALRSLAEIYHVQFKVLAENWFKDRFFPKGEISEPIVLPSAAPSEKQTELILPEEHVELQAKLEPGSQVAICATNFIENRYFELALKNIKRGISYHHLVPEECRSDYQAFVSRLEEKIPALRKHLDRKRIFFTPRVELDFPISYVLYLHPNKKLEGFVALPLGDGPQCYQRATLELSWKLYSSFRWSLAIAEDPRLRKALSSLYLDIREMMRLEKTPSITPRGVSTR